MTATSPPAPRRRGAAVVVVVAVAGTLAFLLLLATAPAAAAPGTGEPRLDVTLGWRDDLLAAEVRLHDAFDADVRGAVASGLPVTLEIQVELWRHRARWFDAQVVTAVRRVRIRWDPGERRYVVDTAGRRTWEESFATLDEAFEQLSVRVVPLAPAGDLRVDRVHFATVEAAIRHLTLDEVAELDGWIRGKLGASGAPPEETAGPAPGEEEDSGLGGAFFGLLLRWAGFGDRVLEARTPAGELAGLPVLPPAP